MRVIISKERPSSVFSVLPFYGAKRKIHLPPGEGFGTINPNLYQYSTKKGGEQEEIRFDKKRLHFPFRSAIIPTPRRVRISVIQRLPKLLYYRDENPCGSKTFSFSESVFSKLSRYLSR